MTDAAFLALDRAVERDGHDWAEILGWMKRRKAVLWSIGGVGFVLTFANSENEIEVLLAGGERAAECVGPWEAKMLTVPAHKGCTLRVDGRKGWRRLLPNWNCDENGVLTLKVV